MADPRSVVAFLKSEEAASAVREAARSSLNIADAVCEALVKEVQREPWAGMLTLTPSAPNPDRAGVAAVFEHIREFVDGIGGKDVVLEWRAASTLDIRHSRRGKSPSTVTITMTFGDG
jgi:hypothetical protein